MFLPFLVVTAAKIVQAHVGVKGLIEALDANRPPAEVCKQASKQWATERLWWQGLGLARKGRRRAT
jgi:hypothetical protein